MQYIIPHFYPPYDFRLKHDLDMFVSASHTYTRYLMVHKHKNIKKQSKKTTQTDLYYFLVCH